MEHSQSAPCVEDAYLNTISPYVSQGDTALLMGPHPFSDTRRSIAMLPDMQMKKVWALRRRGNCPVPTGSSQTVEPLGQKKDREFTSLGAMQMVRRKHTRALKDPLHKWEEPRIASQLVGWEMQKENAPRKPWEKTHPRIESDSTRCAQSLHSSNIELCLRFDR